MSRLKLDPFSLLLLAVVAIAVVVPVTGAVAAALGIAIKAGIAAMFFVYGARLESKALWAALIHWRLHLTVLAMTYALFPVLGVGLNAVFAGWLTPSLAIGVLFLCVLPSTVQSSIAFTSIAGGNVPAAVCAASTSNLLGVFLTPVLVGALIHSGGGAGVSWSAVQAIVLQLLAPFLAGQLARPLIGAWVQRHAKSLGRADRSVILVVVYAAFSAAVVEGLWDKISGPALVAVVVLSVVLLALVLAGTTYISRAFKFPRADEIVIVFCGSKKSLATGVPMAGVLFAPADVGTVIVPLMIFHQLQLLACAVLAQRYAKRRGTI